MVRPAVRARASRRPDSRTRRDSFFFLSPCLAVFVFFCVEGDLRFRGSWARGHPGGSWAWGAVRFLGDGALFLRYSGILEIHWLEYYWRLGLFYLRGVFRLNRCTAIARDEFESFILHLLELD